MPRAVAAGLKAAAARSPSAYFGRLAVGRVRSRAPKELSVRAFDSLDEARQWLRGFGD